jgi:S-adenosylhomocysteine hydrolase
MPRKKAEDQDKLFSYPVRTRVTEKAFNRLEKLRETSNCSTIGELARKVLSNQEIKCFYIDRSLPAVMEELALVRKELKAIGTNINQLTRSFNSTHDENAKAFYVLKVSDLYKTVDAKVNELLSIISSLSKKWLQK